MDVVKHSRFLILNIRRCSEHHYCFPASVSTSLSTFPSIERVCAAGSCYPTRFLSIISNLTVGHWTQANSYEPNLRATSLERSIFQLYSSLADFLSRHCLDITVDKFFHRTHSPWLTKVWHALESTGRLRSLT